MKTKTTLAILAVTATMTSNLWAANAIETTEVINAQTQITKGYIDNLLDQVSQKKMDSQFNAKDYLDQTQEAQNKVEAAMLQFETVLEKDILPKASFWIDQYNAIYKSKDYSEEQKRILLSQRFVNLNKQFDLLSVSYKAAIKNVYGLVPFAKEPITYNLSMNSKSYDPTKNATEVAKMSLAYEGKTYVSQNFTMNLKKIDDGGSATVQFVTADKKVDAKDGSYGFSYDSSQTAKVLFNKSRWYFVHVDYEKAASDLGVKDSLVDDMYKKVVYQKIKGSCVSSICVGLKSAEYTNLLIMIRKLIDRDINLKLADGNTLSIESFDNYIDDSLSLLSRVDYPEDLPFDI